MLAFKRCQHTSQLWDWLWSLHNSAYPQPLICGVCVCGRLWKTCRSMLNNKLNGFKKWNYAAELKNSGNELYIFEPNVLVTHEWCFQVQVCHLEVNPPRRMSCQPDDIILLQVGVSTSHASPVILQEDVLKMSTCSAVNIFVAFWNSDATCIYNTIVWAQWILTNEPFDRVKKDCTEFIFFIHEICDCDLLNESDSSLAHEIQNTKVTPLTGSKFALRIIPYFCADNNF